MRVILFALLLCVPVLLCAQEPDTLRTYIPKRRFIYYRDTSMRMQAARFILGRPCALRQVRVLMQGEGTATIHVYGGEGGMAAPLLRKDLVAPIPIRKTGAGIGVVDVPLPEPVAIDDPQFFVGIDDMSSGLRVLSDEMRKFPSCTAGADAYYPQLIQNRDGTWKWGRYAYAIDAIVDYRSAVSTIFHNVADESHIPDSMLCNGSIAWHDVNRDGYIDLMVGGRLFRNNGDGTFSDVSASVGLTGKPAANFFMDVNNDDVTDIVFLGERAENGDVSNTLFLNNGNGAFVGRALNLAGIRNPTSFSIEDVNNDGLLDMFIGQDGAVGSDTLSGKLFLNDGRLGFTHDTALASGFGQSSGSQWVDYDRDGHPDLYVADHHHVHGMIWRNDGQGGLSPLAGGMAWRSSDLPAAKRGAGCSWGDYDNDGRPDLLLPWADARSTSVAAISHVLFPFDEENEEDLARLNQGFSYEAHRSGGVWGDINNDGLLDIVTTTSCACNGMDIYEQVPDQGFRRKTFEYGLFGIPGGADAVLVDYDNDGRLDLSFMEGGRFRLYRNVPPVTGNTNFIAIDLSKLTEQGRLVGTKAIVYAGAQQFMREISSGRGALMQDPARLYIGLGTAATIDSLVLYSAGGAVGAFTDLKVNSVNYLLPSNRVSRDLIALQVDAYPNPFTSDLQITYQIPEEGRVTLEMYSLAGDKVATIADGREGAGSHTVVWKARDGNGMPLPAGTYIYRLGLHGQEVHGRAVLTR